MFAHAAISSANEKPAPGRARACDGLFGRFYLRHSIPAFAILIGLGMKLALLGLLVRQHPRRFRLRGLGHRARRNLNTALLEFLAVNLHDFTPVTQAFNLNAFRANLIVVRDSRLKMLNFMGRGLEKTSLTSTIPTPWIQRIN
jgi:hypothetical protein